MIDCLPIVCGLALLLAGWYLGRLEKPKPWRLTPREIGLMCRREEQRDARP